MYLEIKLLYNSRLFYLLFSAHDDRSHYNQPGEEFSHPNSYLDCNESCCGRGASCSLGRSTLGGGQDSSIGNLGESSGDFCDCCTQCREAVEEGEVPQVNSTFEFFGWAFKNYLLSKGEEGVTTVSPKLVMYVGKGWEGRSRAIKKICRCQGNLSLR